MRRNSLVCAMGGDGSFYGFMLIYSRPIVCLANWPLCMVSVFPFFAARENSIVTKLRMVVYIGSDRVMIVSFIYR